MKKFGLASLLPYPYIHVYTYIYIHSDQEARSDSVLLRVVSHGGWLTPCVVFVAGSPLLQQL